MITFPTGPVLTAQQIRAAEQAAVESGISVELLMERAGTAVADAVFRFGSAGPVLILCGPGNNGGDGYIAAARLAALGIDVRVAATGVPTLQAAISARTGWKGAVETLESAAPAPILVDGIFGTGLNRALDPALEIALARLRGEAAFTIAVDLPSGVDTDNGRLLGGAGADLTLALGALKPSHLLFPAAGLCGVVQCVDIGIDPQSRVMVRGRPHLAAPVASDHKYSRGMVIVAAGQMAGAGLVTAQAAQRAGAGYVVLADGSGGHPSLVQKSFADALGDSRAQAAIIGPGLGLGTVAREKLALALESDLALVIDADALRLLAEIDRLTLSKRRAPMILTPHAGEFDALFGRADGSKIDRAIGAAGAIGATVIFKGPDTVIATHDGRAALVPPAPHWLATAGTGDVLAGVCGALLARGLGGFDAACAAVWLHGEAARMAGPGLIADDLAPMFPAILARCQ